MRVDEVIYGPARRSMSRYRSEKAGAGEDPAVSSPVSRSSMGKRGRGGSTTRPFSRTHVIFAETVINSAPEPRAQGHRMCALRRALCRHAVTSPRKRGEGEKAPCHMRSPPSVRKGARVALAGATSIVGLSSVPALGGMQKGTRCKTAAAPATVGGEPFSMDHWRTLREGRGGR